jgi:hypothetical protein
MRATTTISESPVLPRPVVAPAVVVSPPPLPVPKPPTIAERPNPPVLPRQAAEIAHPAVPAASAFAPIQALTRAPNAARDDARIRAEQAQAAKAEAMSRHPPGAPQSKKKEDRKKDDGAEKDDKKAP